MRKEVALLQYHFLGQLSEKLGTTELAGQKRINGKKHKCKKVLPWMSSGKYVVPSISLLFHAVWFTLASNKAPRGCFIIPPPAGLWWRMGRKRQNSCVRMRTI